VLSEQLDDCPEKDAQRAKLNEEYHRSVRPGKFKSPKKSVKKSKAFSQVIANADICSDSDTSGDEDPDDRDDVTIPSSICICQAPGYFDNKRKKQVPTEAMPIKSQIVIVKIAKEQGIKRKRHNHNKDN
jgi:hypothetical protein